MSDHVDGAPASLAAFVSERYTVEELAVLAALVGLDSLPGVPSVHMEARVRSVATRSLLVRDIVVLADDNIEINQPHALFVATVIDARRVVRVARIHGGPEHPATWFATGTNCVCVPAHEDGIITLSAHRGDPVALALASRGVLQHVDAGRAQLRSASDEVLVVTEDVSDGAHTSTSTFRLTRAGEEWTRLPPE